MEAKQRTQADIIRDLNRNENTSGMSSKDVPVYTRRTTVHPYVSEYRKNAICTIPYGEDNFEFSFSVRKAQALQKMMKDGSFDRLVEAAEKKQKEIDAREHKKVDVIQL